MREMKGKEREVSMQLKLNQAWGVILGWIVANLLGVAAIGAVTLIFSLIKFFPGMPGPSLVIGLPIGFAQWIALRRAAPVSILWVLTISAGLLFGLVLTISPIPVVNLGSIDDESPLAFMLMSAIMGIFVGLPQWLLLRVHFNKSFVWMLGSAVAFGLGIGLVAASDLIDRSPIASVIFVVLVYALGTGFVISWLSASHRKAGGNPASAP
jgi:hypothetical protein